MNQKGRIDSIHLRSTGSLPYYRSVNSLAIVARFMEQGGIDVADLLSGSGIHPEDLDDPDVFVTIEQELLFLRKIPAMTADPEIGLKVGQHYHLGIQGKLGPAAISCDTFLDAIQMTFKYIALTLAYCQYDLSASGDLAILKMKELIDLKDIRVFVCEREFVSVYRIAQDMLGRLPQLHEVRLAYPKPAHASSYENVFKCPVRFNASEHMMSFDSSYLSMPLPMANPLARNTYEKECSQEMLRLRLPESFADRARHFILFNHGGFPSFSRLARNMNVSQRTLRRRLTEEGFSYKMLMEDIRKKKAIEFLEKTTGSMENIAAELGYSDVPNFYRAFKRWTGTTPSEYRRGKESM